MSSEQYPPDASYPATGSGGRGSSEELLRKTMRLFLQQLASELSLEVDWRAKGHGRNVLHRAAIYSAAMARDLVRIPLHHHAGIAQARFRTRIKYISETAIPVLRFFSNESPWMTGSRESFKRP